MLSYRLLFGQHPRSRKRVRRLLAAQRTKEQPNGNNEDPLLEKVCTLTNKRLHQELPSSSWPPSCVSYEGHLLEQEVYSAELDFPILGSRLLRIQAFNLRQQPRRIRDLWRDRRNPLQWYTFWAVLIIGGATILLGVLQLLVSTAQLVTSIYIK